MNSASKFLVPAVALVMIAGACGSSSEDSGSAQESQAAPATTATTLDQPVESQTTQTSVVTTTEPEVVVDDVAWEAVDAALAVQVEEAGLTGAALRVVTAEGVVHSIDVGDFTPDRVSLIASASKMLASGVLLSLADDGLLDLDAPISTFVDWGIGNPDITTAQLLSNSSGLVALTEDPTFGPYICQYVSDGSLQECAEAIFSTAADDDKIIEPDVKFKYGGAQWQVAGAVAEVVSGKSWAELVQEIYVEPCGVNSLAFNNHWSQIAADAGPFTYPPFNSDPGILAQTDNPNIEGGAYISADDYATLLQMHLNGGYCDSNQVLTQAALDEAHADRIGSAYEGDTGGGDEGYGLGWWVDRDVSGLIHDAGAFGAVPWLNLDGGYGVYLVVEETSATGGAIRKVVEPFIDEAMGY